MDEATRMIAAPFMRGEQEEEVDFSTPLFGNILYI